MCVYGSTWNLQPFSLVLTCPRFEFTIRSCTRATAVYSSTGDFVRLQTGWLFSVYTDETQHVMFLEFLMRLPVRSFLSGTYYVQETPRSCSLPISRWFDLVSGLFHVKHASGYEAVNSDSEVVLWLTRTRRTGCINDQGFTLFVRCCRPDLGQSRFASSASFPYGLSDKIMFILGARQALPLHGSFISARELRAQRREHHHG